MTAERGIPDEDTALETAGGADNTISVRCEDTIAEIIKREFGDTTVDPTMWRATETVDGIGDDVFGVALLLAVALPTRQEYRVLLLDGAVDASVFLSNVATARALLATVDGNVELAERFVLAQARGQT